MSGVDIQVQEGIPQTGLYTSDQGMVKLSDLEVLKISRASIRVNNGIGVYKESGQRHGTTYAGGITVTGQITKAMLNFAEHRVVLGADATKQAGEHGYMVKPTALSMAALGEVMKFNSSINWPYKAVSLNAYPLKTDIELIINKDQLSQGDISSVNQIGAEDAEFSIEAGKMMGIIARNAMFTNAVVAFDSRGIITSGPLNFISGAATWKLYTVPVIPE